jgi:hypothetical protein
MSFKKSLIELMKPYESNTTVKAILQSLEGEQKPTKVECAKQGTIADGSMIETPTDWVIDAEVFTTDPDGNQIPVMDGDYVVDGTTAITVMGGKIAEVSTVAEENTDTEMAAEVKETIQSLLTRITELEAEKASHATTLSAITTERDNLAKEKVELSAKIVELGKQPATQSVKKVEQSQEKKDVPTKPFSKMTYEERIAHNLKK